MCEKLCYTICLKKLKTILKLIFSRQMHKSQDPETKAVIGRQKYIILHSDWLTKKKKCQIQKGEEKLTLDP